jgi:hypothetical protein
MDTYIHLASVKKDLPSVLQNDRRADEDYGEKNNWQEKGCIKTMHGKQKRYTYPTRADRKRYSLTQQAWKKR